MLELIANGSYNYAYIGINRASLTLRLTSANRLPHETRGVFVIEVVGDGPAARGGVSVSSGTEELD